MKKLLCIVLVLVLVFMSSCKSPAVERQKRQMLEIFCNDDNYITLTGEVTEINIEDNEVMYMMFVSIKCEDLKQYVVNADDYDYWVFCSSDINICIGDTIVYTTVPNCLDHMSYLPIVEICKNDETILGFEEGKENLINFVKQIQYK